MKREEIERFWNNVDIRGQSECWNWTAGKKSHGYGQIFIAGKNKRAHRVSWEIQTGFPPPDGKVLCHRCDNPSCVNPSHLYVGTQKQNIREAQEKGRLYNHYRNRTHCKVGHELSPENTKLKFHRRGEYYRQCRTCFDKANRSYRLKNKDKYNARRREKRAQIRAVKLQTL